MSGRHHILALLSALALCACSESHTSYDGGAELDATGAPDSAPPDAPVDAGVDAPPPCPDIDGDGFPDARCGGDDCDDADPELSPAAGPCTGPTTTLRCVAGAPVEATCAADTPDCDARTGECAATACGDGVLHPDESCDDANDDELDGCYATCRFSRCGDSSQCPLPSAPWCFPLEGMTIGECSPGHPGGAPSGAPCVTEEDCAAYCDPYQLRCTEACFMDAQCPGVGAWCSYRTISHFERLPPQMSRCEYECRTSADCPSGNVCTPQHLLDRGFVATACRPPTGTADQGEPCGGGCSTGVCLIDGPTSA